MKLLEDRIRKDGSVTKTGFLNLGAFLNHALDVDFLEKLGAQIRLKFKDCGVTKILTAEASGIALACFTAKKFGVNAVFARKTRREIFGGECWSAKIASFSAGAVYDLSVAKACLDESDTVLIVDDFLAGGKEMSGLIEIVRQSGAKLAGVAVAVEKTFKPGGALLRSQNIKLVALSKIHRLTAAGEVEFEK